MVCRFSAALPASTITLRDRGNGTIRRAPSSWPEVRVSGRLRNVPTGPSVSARCARSQPIQGLSDPADGLADPLFVLHEGEADMVVAGGAEADPGTHGNLGFLEEVEGKTQ